MEKTPNKCATDANQQIEKTLCQIKVFFVVLQDAFGKTPHNVFLKQLGGPGGSPPKESVKRQQHRTLPPFIVIDVCCGCCCDIGVLLL